MISSNLGREDDRGSSFDTKRRMFHLVAWEASSNRQLGEHDMIGDEASCPTPVTTRDGVPDDDFTGGTSYDAIATWARRT